MNLKSSFGKIPPKPLPESWRERPLLWGAGSAKFGHSLSPGLHLASLYHRSNLKPGAWVLLAAKVYSRLLFLHCKERSYSRPQRRWRGPSEEQEAQARHPQWGTWAERRAVGAPGPRHVLTAHTDSTRPGHSRCPSADSCRPGPWRAGASPPSPGWSCRDTQPPRPWPGDSSRERPLLLPLPQPDTTQPPASLFSQMFKKEKGAPQQQDVVYLPHSLLLALQWKPGQQFSSLATALGFDSPLPSLLRPRHAGLGWMDDREGRTIGRRSLQDMACAPKCTQTRMPGNVSVLAVFPGRPPWLSLNSSQRG